MQIFNDITVTLMMFETSQQFHDILWHVPFFCENPTNLEGTVDSESDQSL